MNKTLALLTIALALASNSRAADGIILRAQSEFWGDDSMTHTMAKTLGSAAKDEKAVRAQLAGTNDAFFQTRLLFYPEEVRFGEFTGFPAVFFRGISLANYKRRNCSITLIFTKTHTYTIHCFSPEESNLPDPKAHIHIDGDPSEATEVAFRFLEPRFKEGLPKLQELVRQAVAAAASSAASEVKQSP